MTDSKNTHWTMDRDLLESFILNRISVQERGELESHLETCLDCRKVVQDEREILVGIRSYGRDELKKKLRNLLEQRQPRPISWITIASAAVILLLVGLGIYNRAFLFGRREFSQRDSGVPVEIKEQQQAGKETEQEIGRQNQKLQKKDGVAAPDEVEPKMELRFKGNEDAAAPTPMSRNSTGAGTGVAVEKPLQSLQFEAKESLGPNIIWVEGTMADESSMPRPVAKLRASSQPRKSGQETAFSSARVDSFSRDVKGHSLVIIDQRPVKELPLEHQSRARAADVQSVVTRVERREEGMHFTLYLDSLMDETDLKVGQIWQISSDSLVLQISRRRIGYRIPGNWLTPK